MNKILVIDNDSSISYQHTVISSEVNCYLSLDDLFNIFKESHQSIFQANTDNCLMLVLDDGLEISLHEYQSYQKPIFLKIFIPDSNPIFISMTNNHHISNSKYYYQKGKTYPAIKYCQSLKIQINNKRFIGCMPTFYQLENILKYIGMLNYIFKYFKTNPLWTFYLNTPTYFWTSTKFNINGWNMCIGHRPVPFPVGTSQNDIFPFFKNLN